MARIACTLNGRRPNHNVRSIDSGTDVPASPWRWRKNCDGFLSPISSISRRWRVFYSWDELRRLTICVFSVSYAFSLGGFTIISLLYITRESSALVTFVNFSSSSRMPDGAKVRPTNENHNSGSEEINVGTRHATRFLERALSRALSGTFSRSSGLGWGTLSLNMVDSDTDITRLKLLLLV